MNTRRITPVLGLLTALAAATSFGPTTASAAPDAGKKGAVSKGSGQKASAKATPSTPAKPTTAVTHARTPQQIAQREREVKLKPGANGKLCRDCHAEMAKTLAKTANLHTPVKQDECTGCHNPHASDHGKLLASSAKTLCDRCHDVRPAKAKQIHAPLLDDATPTDAAEAPERSTKRARPTKGCAACHDPHGSASPGVLLEPQRALCGGCHKAIEQAVAKAKRRHAPVEEGCTKECHDPHASTEASGLLRQEVQALCTRCHSPKEKAFEKAHQGFPVADARCIGCHDPHGSSTRGMLYDDVHKPVAQGNCTDCHEPPVAGQPLKLRQAGTALCKSCHAEVMDKMLKQGRLHGALQGPDACLNCHAPHASASGKLVKGKLVEVCGECHTDTLARQGRSPARHKALTEGNCASCHDPHASSEALALKKDGIAMCATCHEWQRHSSHPIGPKYKDPRNPNLHLDCLSCHRAHGTEFRQMMPAATTSLMCTQCHSRFSE